MKRQIYQDCHVLDFNQGIHNGVEIDRSGSMSLSDILNRNSFNNHDKGSSCATSQFFMISSPNKYEVSQD